MYSGRNCCIWGQPTRLSSLVGMEYVLKLIGNHMNWSSPFRNSTDGSCYLQFLCVSVFLLPGWQGQWAEDSLLCCDCISV